MAAQYPEKNVFVRCQFSVTETQLDSVVETILPQEASMLHIDMFELSYPSKITDLMKEEGKDFSIHTIIIRKCVLKGCFLCQTTKTTTGIT